MRYHDIEQGTQEWFKARLGKPTTSCFGKLVTPTGKRSGQLEGYADRLVNELITGELQSSQSPTFAMERGIEMEAQAADMYANINGCEFQNGGFITNDDGNCGASIDRLVMKDSKVIGGLEIKCPLFETQEQYLEDYVFPKKYKPQVQGQLLVCELEWVDFFAFHPETLSLQVRVERDEEYIQLLRDAIEEIDELIISKLF